MTTASPVLAASPDDCLDTGLEPFPEPINVYDRNDDQPPTTNLFPYTDNGWTARTTGGIDKGAFSFNSFGGAGFRNTMDPVARAGAELHTYVTAIAETMVGCSYTISTQFEFTGVGNDRPMAAWITVDGEDYAVMNSNNTPTSGSRSYTFVATSATTTIGLHTRVTGTANANGGVDINMSAPALTCTCPA